MKTLALFYAFIVVMMLSGCAPKEVQITLLPEENGKVGTISIADNKGEKHTINQAYEALDISQKGTIEAKNETEKTVYAKYAEVLNTLPPKSQSYLFFFSFDSAILDTKQLAELKTIAQMIRENNIIEVVCIGHSDSAGDKEYNKILSLRRAKSVANALIKDGVDKSLIKLQYYGDVDPLVPTDDAKPNAKNRRTEVILK